MEFFLEGHMEAFGEIGGIPHRGRYDNLKSVVIRRRPETIYNSQFLDFARHYGFSIYLCTPGRANEKGRVERVIRDMEDHDQLLPGPGSSQWGIYQGGEPREIKEFTAQRENLPANC
jgi:hypothetical protein